MTSLLDLERRIETLEYSLAALHSAVMGTQLNVAILTGTPLDANREVPVNQETIEELIDPDA